MKTQYQCISEQDYQHPEHWEPSTHAVPTQGGAVGSRTTSIQNIGNPVPMQYLPREER
jgi:hypothetical protein